MIAALFLMFGCASTAPVAPTYHETKTVKIVGLINHNLIGEDKTQVIAKINELLLFASSRFKEEFNVVFQLIDVKPIAFERDKNGVESNKAFHLVQKFAEKNSYIKDGTITLAFVDDIYKKVYVTNLLGQVMESYEKEVCGEVYEIGGYSGIINLQYHRLTFCVVHEIIHLFGGMPSEGFMKHGKTITERDYYFDAETKHVLQKNFNKRHLDDRSHP